MGILLPERRTFGIRMQHAVGFFVGSFGERERATASKLLEVTDFRGFGDPNLQLLGPTNSAGGILDQAGTDLSNCLQSARRL